MTDLTRYLDPQVIQQVGRLDLRARFIVEGFLAGLHASPFHGLSVEFSEHRKYSPGDDPRTIDWGVFARTDRLFVRRHRAETHLACYLLVDTSASMGYVGALGGAAAGTTRETPGPWPQPHAKLLYAIHIAAAIGYLITRQQDAVGLALLGDGLENFLPARSRRAHLLQLLAMLAGEAPRGKTNLAAGISAALARIPHRGLIIMLSDLLTDADALLRGLHEIRYRGHDLILMHVLDAAEAQFRLEGAVRLEDPESGETMQVDASAVRDAFIAAIASWRESLAQQLAAMRADYVALDTSMPFDRALVEFLNQRRRRR